MMGLVQGSAVMAGTRRLPAAFVHLGQGGHEHGTGCFELLQPAVQHLLDSRWVPRHAHGKPQGLPVRSYPYRPGPRKP